MRKTATAIEKCRHLCEVISNGVGPFYGGSESLKALIKAHREAMEALADLARSGESDAFPKFKRLVEVLDDIPMVPLNFDPIKMQELKEVFAMAREAVCHELVEAEFSSPPVNPPPDLKDPGLPARDQRAMAYWRARDREQPEWRTMSDFAANEAYLLREKVADKDAKIDELRMELEAAQTKVAEHDAARAGAVLRASRVNEAVGRAPAGTMFRKGADGVLREIL